MSPGLCTGMHSMRLWPRDKNLQIPCQRRKKGISAVNTGRFAGGVPIAWAARALTDACAGAACVLLYGGNVGFARQLAPHMGVHVLIPENLPAGIPFSAALSRTGAKCVFLIPGFYRLRVSGRRRDFTAVSPREISDFAAGKRPKVFYSKPERSYYINTGNPSCVEFLFFDTADTIIKKAGALLSRGITPRNTPVGASRAQPFSSPRLIFLICFSTLLRVFIISSAAAKTAHFEVCSYAQHQPLIRAASVLFLHCEYIPHKYVHIYSPFLPFIFSQYFLAACSVLLLPYS